MALRTGGLLRTGVGLIPPQWVEPFTLGQVDISWEAPFSILANPIVVEWVSTFTLGETSASEWVAPFMMGETTSVDWTAPFNILSSSTGGFLGTSPAAPLLGWRDRS